MVSNESADTFSNEKEIDLKRTRDVQLIESNIETLQTNLKNADERQADARARIAQYKKRNAAVPGPLQDDFERSEGEKIKIQNKTPATVTLNRFITNFSWLNSV